MMYEWIDYEAKADAWAEMMAEMAWWASQQEAETENG